MGAALLARVAVIKMSLLDEYMSVIKVSIDVMMSQNKCVNLTFGEFLS